jgi:hypothetical protein
MPLLVNYDFLLSEVGQDCFPSSKTIILSLGEIASIVKLTTQRTTQKLRLRQEQQPFGLIKVLQKVLSREGINHKKGGMYYHAALGNESHPRSAMMPRIR